MSIVHPQLRAAIGARVTAHPDQATDVIVALIDALDLRPEEGVDPATASFTDPKLHPWVPGAAIRPLMAALQRLSEA